MVEDDGFLFGANGLFCPRRLVVRFRESKLPCPTLGIGWAWPQIFLLRYTRDLKINIDTRNNNILKGDTFSKTSLSGYIYISIQMSMSGWYGKVKQIDIQSWFGRGWCLFSKCAGWKKKSRRPKWIIQIGSSKKPPNPEYLIRGLPFHHLKRSPKKLEKPGTSPRTKPVNL